MWMRNAHWVIFKMKITTSGFLAFISIDELNAQELKRRENWLYYGLGTIKMRYRSKMSISSVKRLKDDLSALEVKEGASENNNNSLANISEAAEIVNDNTELVNVNVD